MHHIDFVLKIDLNGVSKNPIFIRGRKANLKILIAEEASLFLTDFKMINLRYKNLK